MLVARLQKKLVEFNHNIQFQMRLLFCVTLVASQQKNELEFWNLDRPKDMANIASLEVMCGKTHMEVQINFDRSFNGIIFSKGAVDQYNCIYVKPQTGSSAYSFNILYNQVIFILFCTSLYKNIETILCKENL